MPALANKTDPAADVPRYHTTLPSPLGPLHLGASDIGLVLLIFGSQMTRDDAPGRDVIEAPEHPILALAARELTAYFDGASTAFTVPLLPRGTPLQRDVWRALVAIPFGERRAYREVAAAIGRPGAERVVGAASGQNRIAILIPCHRVIGASGALTSYVGGLDAKRWLLAHEARTTAPSVPRPG